jgi:catechol 2,3-dioxygenase-like lactoylglutathione lyase family enzyme
MQLSYAIKYVADMDRAVAFHRDALGLTPRFQSPFWSEFDTGGTTLALHAASPEHPAGSVQLGFATGDLTAFYEARERLGIAFTQPPTEMHGTRIARFLDPDGAETSVSAPCGEGGQAPV